LLDELLAGAALVVEDDGALSRPRQIGQGINPARSQRDAENAGASGPAGATHPTKLSIALRVYTEIPGHVAGTGGAEIYTDERRLRMTWRRHAG